MGKRKRDGDRVDVPVDQIAKLAQVIAPAVVSHIEIYEAIAAKLIKGASSLSPAGRAALEEAFASDGERGPAFPAKAALMFAVNKAADGKDGDSRDEEEEDGKEKK